MKNQTCPNYGSELVEDAWEDITITEDGIIEIDAYPALICDKECGYRERINQSYENTHINTITDKDTPNLFQFATSELSQDAFLCWLISWSKDTYRSSDRGLHEAAIDFLAAIFDLHQVPFPVLQSVEIKSQFKKLDILVIINETYAVMIEDKTNTKNHSNQLIRYREAVKKSFPDLIQLPIYYKTGDQSHYHSVENAGYLPFKRKMMLEVLKKGIENGVKNHIFLDYYRHLQKLENSIAAFRTKPVFKWSANQWQGFYQEVQKQIDGNWGYVSNPRKGFWGFWCKSPINSWYLQLEQEKFCIKISLEDDEHRLKQGRAAMKEVLRISEEQNLKLQKPVRLREGNTMTIAQRTDYLQTNEDGILDFEKTIEELKSY